VGLIYGACAGPGSYDQARQLMHKQSDDGPRYLRWRLRLGYRVECVGLVWLAGERNCRKITKR
jgi:hypothetical protein